MSEIIYGMPAEEYHKIDALSASTAKILLRSPAHFLAQKESPREPSPQMRFGTLVHAMVLEPETVDRDFAAVAKVDRRTKEGKAAAEAFELANLGKTVVDMDQFQRAQRVKQAVDMHPIANMLFKDGKAEATLLWEQYGIPCKARFDYLRSSDIVDLKTAQDASAEGFSRAIATYQYHMQAAHYAEGLKACSGWEMDNFFFVAVETDAPFNIGIYNIDQTAMQVGRELMRKASIAYKLAQDAESWHGYEPSIQTLGLPKWAMPSDI